MATAPRTAPSSPSTDTSTRGRNFDREWSSRSTGSSRRSPFLPMPPPRTTSSGSTTGAMAAMVKAMRLASTPTTHWATASPRRAAAKTRRALRGDRMPSRRASATTPTPPTVASSAPRRRASSGLAELDPNGRCPTSPAAPVAPRNSSPLTTSPSPTPVPTCRNTKFATPLPSPWSCSPTVATLTSFSMLRLVPRARWSASNTPCRPHPGRDSARVIFRRVGSNTPGLPTVACETCRHFSPASAARPWARSPIWLMSVRALLAWDRSSCRATMPPLRSATAARTQSLPTSTPTTHPAWAFSS